MFCCFKKYQSDEIMESIFDIVDEEYDKQYKQPILKEPILEEIKPLKIQKNPFIKNKIYI